MSKWLKLTLAVAVAGGTAAAAVVALIGIGLVTAMTVALPVAAAMAFQEIDQAAVPGKVTVSAADGVSDSIENEEGEGVDNPEEEELTVPFRLVVPAEIEEGKTYPLIVFLHGAGERGDDNALQLKHFVARMATEQMRQKYPCFILAPQCPKERRWVDVDWGDVRGGAFPERPSLPLAGAIKAYRETLESRPIDRSRIYITGLSMGGYGTWHLADLLRDEVAAAVPICGGGDVGDAKRYVGLPLWVYHGAKDRAVPVERSRQMVEAIRKVDGDVNYTEYIDGGHQIWDDAYFGTDDDPGVLPWLFEQKKADEADGE